MGRILAGVGVDIDDEKGEAGDLAVFIPCTPWLFHGLPPHLGSLPTSAFV